MVYLFQNLSEGPVSVITLSFYTEEDMSKWSPEVEEERDRLTHDSVLHCKEICGRLKANLNIMPQNIFPLLKKLGVLCAKIFAETFNENFIGKTTHNLDSLTFKE